MVNYTTIIKPTEGILKDPQMLSKFDPISKYPGMDIRLFKI